MRDGKLDVLVITEGHPYQATPFFAVFDADPGLDWMQAKQPGAQTFFNARLAEMWDAYVMYDMPGIQFRPGQGPLLHEPPKDVQRGFEDLTEAGHGFVFLHHAIAGWPLWPAYGEAIGGRFHYEPGFFAGQNYPDSGYRFDTWHELSVADPTHPVTAGLEAGFSITDEVYLCPIDERHVMPLMRSDYKFVDTNFSSAALAVRGRRGRRDGWAHPQGSNLIAWINRYRNSDIVVIACGDGPSAYANPGFRRLLGNAIRWVARDRPGGPAIPYPG